jgi:hypothetical protein
MCIAGEESFTGQFGLKFSNKNSKPEAEPEMLGLLSAVIFYPTNSSVAN